MVSTKRTTAPTHTQQSNLDWNAPKDISTPRGEYAFMMDGFSPVWGIDLHSSFGPGPVNGSSAVAQ
jgi:hypothetical protein